MKNLKNQINALFANPLFAKYQILILPFLAIFICALLLIFLIVPHFLELSKSNKVIDDTKTKYSNLDVKLKVLKETDKTLFKDNVQTTLVALPTEKDIPDALNQVLFLISSSRLVLDDMTFSSKADTSNSNQGKVDNFQIKVSVTGETIALKDFILKIKKIPRIMKVIQLEVIGGRAIGNVQSTISLAVYFQPLPQSIGTVEKPLGSLTDDELTLLSQIKENQKNVPTVAVPSTDSVVVSTGLVGKPDPFQ